MESTLRKLCEDNDDTSLKHMPQLGWINDQLKAANAYNAAVHKQVIAWAANNPKVKFTGVISAS